MVWRCTVVVLALAATGCEPPQNPSAFGDLGTAEHAVRQAVSQASQAQILADFNAANGHDRAAARKLRQMARAEDEAGQIRNQVEGISGEAIEDYNRALDALEGSMTRLNVMFDENGAPVNAPKRKPTPGQTISDDDAEAVARTAADRIRHSREALGRIESYLKELEDLSAKAPAAGGDASPD